MVRPAVPGTLFRGLILADIRSGPARKDFLPKRNNLAGIRIADPFMGGGTPLIEANRVGCEVQGFDINPMATWIVREEIDSIDVSAYRQAARRLLEALRTEIGPYYRTSCPLYGDANVPVKSFLWVKILDCTHCGQAFDLFPGYLVARKPASPDECLGVPDLW